MTTLQNLEQAEHQLATAHTALKAAKGELGDHFITKSFLTQMTADLYHARMSIAGEIRGRERLGETS